jgi:CubicO group peptidase (beta-lactamase class C family)
MRRILGAMAIVLASAAHGQAQTAEATRMDEVIKATVPPFMGTVIVARGAEVMLSKGYGPANIEWNIPNAPAARFRIGSLTKQFTAASILLLEERGKLSVDDLVKKHMPDAPEAWAAITIFHLLTHSSGIPNFTAFPDYAASELVPTTPEKTIARFKDKPLDFVPGERMSYSNSGYIVLGHLVEKLAGVPYAKFVQDNLFTPIGMKDSGYDSNTALIPRRAAGYVPTATGLVNAPPIHMSIPFAAGGLYSTTEDLLRWEQALFGGRVLSAQSLVKMTTPFKGDYAFGLVIRTVAGKKQIWHNGGIQGFNGMLAYYPDDKLTVAVLSNLNGPNAEEIGAKLGTLATGGAVTLTSERKELTVPPATLAQYAGVYALTPTVNMTITLEGSQLFAVLTGQPKVPMFPESESSFFLKIVDAQIEFVKDAAGNVSHLVLHQAGRDAKATRKN